VLPCPLIVRAHNRLPFGALPPSAPPDLCALRELCVEIPPSRGHQFHTLPRSPISDSFAACPDPVAITAHYCFKSFRCNTYESPRKYCKQQTYSLAKPFKCNTYKKHGGPLSTFSCAVCIPNVVTGRFGAQAMAWSIPFIFLILQTYLHNGRCSTLLESIHYALSSSRRRVYPSPRRSDVEGARLTLTHSFITSETP
jgi:hypothetical protein